MNSDRSVAIGAGLSLNPTKSRFYDSFDELRFEHLQRLRNDASCRARELNIIEGKAIAVDYHCDSSDSRFPADKSFSKSPDKNGDMVYAHRPQILWDSIAGSAFFEVGDAWNHNNDVELKYSAGVELNMRLGFRYGRMPLTCGLGFAQGFDEDEGESQIYFNLKLDM